MWDVVGLLGALPFSLRDKHGPRDSSLMVPPSTRESFLTEEERDPREWSTSAWTEFPSSSANKTDGPTTLASCRNA